MYGANLKTIPKNVDGRKALSELLDQIRDADSTKKLPVDLSQSYLTSEHLLVRFLMAKQWDAQEAGKALLAHYEWRLEPTFAQILGDPFPDAQDIKRHYPQSFHGVDKLGRPIYIERPGLIDMPTLLTVTSPKRVLEYVVLNAEKQVARRFPACSLARGEVVDRSLNILDLEGLSFRGLMDKTARDVIKDIVNLMQKHYPEMTGKTIIINAPTSFSLLWNFITPMLDESYHEKIEIISRDKTKIAQAMLELVDADQLPVMYGGKCCCDGKDPISCMMGEKGPWKDPEIEKVLDSEPLERLLTKEGCRILIERRRQNLPPNVCKEEVQEEQTRDFAMDGEFPPTASSARELEIGDDRLHEKASQLARGTHVPSGGKQKSPAAGVPLGKHGNARACAFQIDVGDSDACVCICTCKPFGWM